MRRRLRTADVAVEARDAVKCGWEAVESGGVVRICRQSPPHLLSCIHPLVPIGERAGIGRGISSAHLPCISLRVYLPPMDNRLGQLRPK